MRSVLLNIDGNKFNVKFIKDNTSLFWHAALINGETVRYHFSHGHLLLKDSLCRIVYNTALSGLLQSVQIDGHNVPVELENSLPGSRQATSAKSGAEKKGDKAVPAPLNGQVVRILKKKGEQVEVGEKVLVLESMKMENEVTAPVSGIVRKIYPKEGAIVSSGQLLFEIE